MILALIGWWFTAASVLCLAWVIRNEINIVKERRAAEKDWGQLMANTPHVCNRGHNWVGATPLVRPWECPPCPTCGRMCITCDDDPEESCC